MKKILETFVADSGRKSFSLDGKPISDEKATDIIVEECPGEGVIVYMTKTEYESCNSSSNNKSENP